MPKSHRVRISAFSEMHLHTTARPQAKPVQESVDVLAILFLNGVCMSVRMYVCMYALACMYACMYVCMYGVCVYVYMLSLIHI